MRLSHHLAVLLGCTALLAMAGPGCSNKQPESPASVAKAPEEHLAANFANELGLLKYAAAQKDTHTWVTFQWKALQKPSQDYWVFIHGIDGSGKILFQFDHALKNSASVAASSWAPGDIVDDSFPITPPPGHGPGKCTLRIGLYVPHATTPLVVISTDLSQPADNWRGRAVLLPALDCQ